MFHYITSGKKIRELFICIQDFMTLERPYFCSVISNMLRISMRLSFQKSLKQYGAS